MLLLLFSFTLCCLLFIINTAQVTICDTQQYFCKSTTLTYIYVCLHLRVHFLHIWIYTALWWSLLIVCTDSMAFGTHYSVVWPTSRYARRRRVLVCRSVCRGIELVWWWWKEEKDHRRRGGVGDTDGRICRCGGRWVLYVCFFLPSIVLLYW